MSFIVIWLQCLFYTELPFAEDLRQFTFGSLPVEEVDAAVQPLNRKFTPTGKLCISYVSDKKAVLSEFVSPGPF